MAVLVLVTQKGFLWGKHLQTKRSFCGEQRVEAQEVRSPCSAAETEWGPWALSHARAAPAWLSEGPWLEDSGETRVGEVKCSWASRCSEARCVCNFEL